MLDKKDLHTLEAILCREGDLISQYEAYLQQIRQPQLRSDIQSLLAQHRNQYNTMLSIMEGSK